MTNWTQEQEAAARARCDAATKGPWEEDVVDSTKEGKRLIIFGTDRLGTLWVVRTKEMPYHTSYGGARSDAEFCAHARKDLPDALDENQRLREELIKAWTHTSCVCPCSDTPSYPYQILPLDECICGLNEVLYAVH